MRDLIRETNTQFASVRRRGDRQHTNVPALTLFPRSAGQHDFEVQARDIPRVTSAIGFQVDSMRDEQVVG